MTIFAIGVHAVPGKARPVIPLSLQTFTPEKSLVENPGFEQQRAEAHHQLQELIRAQEIDPPLFPLLSRFRAVPHCFTIQSCYGHFVCEQEPDIKIPPGSGPLQGAVSPAWSTGWRILPSWSGMPVPDKAFSGISAGCPSSILVMYSSVVRNGSGPVR